LEVLLGREEELEADLGCVVDSIGGGWDRAVRRDPGGFAVELGEDVLDAGVVVDGDDVRAAAADTALADHQRLHAVQSPVRITFTTGFALTVVGMWIV
jgi:hypothetical protein